MIHVMASGSRLLIDEREPLISGALMINPDSTQPIPISMRKAVFFILRDAILRGRLGESD